MKEIAVITHASDIDGIGSAALIIRKYSVPLGRIFFSDYSKESIAYAERGLRKVLKKGRGTTLFITDLGMNQGLVSAFIRMIKRIKKNGGKVFWFDHHVWSKADIRNVAERCDLAIVGENRRLCATEITRRELRLDGGFERRFADLVHYSDFNILPKERWGKELIGTYAMATTLYNTLGYGKRYSSLRHIAAVLSTGRFLDAKIKHDANNFAKLNEKRIRAMINHLYKVIDNAYLGFSEDVQSTQACAAIMEKTGCDIGIYVNTRYEKAHLRSRHADISVLASKLGGGGHPHAAGFDIEEGVYNHFKTEKERMRFVSFLEKKISEPY